MKIVVENNLIETKDIVSIEESGHRMHGFVIHLIDGTNIRIEKKEEFDIYPSQCAHINDMYRILKDKVVVEWNKDKTNIPVLRL
jgi:predicted lipase